MIGTKKEWIIAFIKCTEIQTLIVGGIEYKGIWLDINPAVWKLYAVKNSQWDVNQLLETVLLQIYHSRHIKENISQRNYFISFWKLKNISLEMVTLASNTKVPYSTVTGVEWIRSDLPLYTVTILGPIHTSWKTAGIWAFSFLILTQFTEF